MGNVKFFLLLAMILAYSITAVVKGTFKDNIMESNYSKAKKKFVDFLDYYVSFGYCASIIISYIIKQIFLIRPLMALKKKTKFIIWLILYLLDFNYTILLTIKFIFTDDILIEVCTFKKTPLICHIWFYLFNIAITIIFYLISIINFNLVAYIKEDSKFLSLSRVKGINIQKNY